MTTTTKISLKVLPAALVAVFKAQGKTRRNVRLVVVHDDAFTLQAWDTRWGGGTRNVYGGWTFGTDVMVTYDVAEGDTLKASAGGVVVVASTFCGQDADPVVYVRSADLPAFYGVTLPAEFMGMPGEIAADWMTEEAGRVGGKARKNLEKLAELFRTLTGVAAA